ncbi:MAG: hypothetical protein HY073_03845, partial [Deltaproteobacteria bacterium]|nr:hypothetical protein [Deltaproteobacteria bacterium]
VILNPYVKLSRVALVKPVAYLSESYLSLISGLFNNHTTQATPPAEKNPVVRSLLFLYYPRRLEVEKVEEWFKTLNKKIDRISTDVVAVRTELSDIREFIEQHQTDIRLCKLAIERVDDKVDNLKKSAH